MTRLRNLSITMDLRFLVLLALLCVANVSSQLPPPTWDPARNPLFAPVVQDFVADAFEQFLNEVDDPDIISIQRLSPDEAYSVFYRMVYDSQQKAGNPNARFHAQCKAQSVRENYQYADGSYIFLVAAYTAGEVMFQKEVLTPENQKSLSSQFVRDINDAVKSVTVATAANTITAAYEGYVKFVTSQGLVSKTTAFNDPAVFTEVINALRLYY